MGVPLVEWLRRRVLVHGGEAAQAAFHHLGPRPLGDLWRGDEVRRSIAFLIPSLWDNSPYTCIEAMAHGKPVIATDNGGQGEMVQHGRSGLVVPAGDADALAEAMRSLWSMTPERRAEMGLEARRRILEVCGTGRVVGERLAFYEKVIQKFHAAGGRARVPHLLPHDDQPMRLGHPKAARKPASRPGKISVVVPCFNLGEYVGETIESLVSSRRKPDEVVVVDDGSTDARTIEVLREWEGRRLPFSFRLLRTRNQGLATARRTGAEACSGEYLVFLDADDRVAPEYLGLCAGILDRHPEAGVATAWYEYFGQCDGGHWTPLAAQFPLFLMENCVGAGAMLRREAYDEAGGPKPAMRHNFEDWELWVAVAEKGWAVVTIPRPLFQYRVRNGSMYREMTPVQFNLLRGLMFEFHPELVRRHALACAQMAESGTGVAVDFSGRTDHRFEFERLREEVFVLREMVGRAKAISRNPLLVLPWLWKKLWKKSGGAA
jgi:glycosyltransferase involved in cell wall biosynthesis